MNLAVIIKAGAVAAALSAMTYPVWKTLSYAELTPVLSKEFNMAQGSVRLAQDQLKEQIDDISKAVLLLRFKNLMESRARGGLSLEDQQELCRIARVLNYVGVPGCP